MTSSIEVGSITTSTENVTHKQHFESVDRGVKTPLFFYLYISTLITNNLKNKHYG